LITIVSYLPMYFRSQVYASHHALPPAPDGIVVLDSLEQLHAFKKTMLVFPGVKEAGGGGD